MDKALDTIPSHIKYYLLEWKDRNLDEFIDKYGVRKLNEFTLDEIHNLFSYATTKDGALLGKINC
jgi:hypothetical protein